MKNQNQINSEIDSKLFTKITDLLKEEEKLPTIVLGGHNVFNNTISNSVVIQLNSGENLAETLEKTPENIQKKLLDAILSVLEKKHSES